MSMENFHLSIVEPVITFNIRIVEDGWFFLDKKPPESKYETPAAFFKKRDSTELRVEVKYSLEDNNKEYKLDLTNIPTDDILEIKDIFFYMYSKEDVEMKRVLLLNSLSKSDAIFAKLDKKHAFNGEQYNVYYGGLIGINDKVIKKYYLIKQS